MKDSMKTEQFFFSFIYLKSHPPVSISDSEQCSCKAEEISIHSQ